MLFLYSALYSEWFYRNKCLSMLLTVICYIYVAGVSFCRVYLGRHSIDQVLLGLELGILCVHFNMNFLKPYLFDSVFFPSSDEETDKTLSRSFKACVWSIVLYLAVLIKMIALYDYVDSSNIIPSQWFQVIEQTCPVYKLSTLFHHASLVYTSVLTFIPGMYICNYLRQKVQVNNGTSIGDPS